MKFIAKTLYGLEPLLAEEIKSLGGKDVVQANRAVIFEGGESLMYRVNYSSRTAVTVLRTIAEYRIKNPDDLYRGGMKIKWSDYMSVSDTFAVVPVVNSALFSHTGFAALKLKDAVADSFRKVLGSRPSVDTKDPQIIINLHISGDRVTVSLDSSGEPLFKRGYRIDSVAAPLNEVLAAGMILLSGWDRKKPFLDPMCGSGTLPVEAAMIAADIPPAKFRKKFGFMNWPGFDEASFDKIKSEAEAAVKQSDTKISGSDISVRNIASSEINITNAGLLDTINLSVADFRESPVSEEDTLIMMNPPYGERLNDGNVAELYGSIGSVLKHRFAGSTAWIISPNRDALNKIGLRPVKKIELFNGSLNCFFQKYELYSGSKKGI